MAVSVCRTVFRMIVISFVCFSLVVTMDTNTNSHEPSQPHGNTDNNKDTNNVHGDEPLNNSDNHGNNTKPHGEAIHGHSNSSHGNHSGHHDGGHHGVHLASLNFDHVQTPLTLCIFLVIVAASKIGFHHADILSSMVPESCLLILLGTVAGIIMFVTDTDCHCFAAFSSDLFFLYLLPPIMLEAAYSLHDRVFFDNLGTILLFAVIGTILNCFILSPALYGLAISGAMGPITITMTQCFVFGALIVAVDPVAVLAIFQEIGVNNVLYFLVFGESLLNDAVTVVIYNTMKVFNKMDTIPYTQILLGIGSFFTVSFGGLAIGLIVGVLCSIFTRFTEHVRVVEPLAMFILAYSSYLLAELFHFSGIISIIACGLMQAQYAFHNISHKSNTTVKYFAKVLSATSDAIIFLFLGIALVSDNHEWHTGFVLWSVLLCVVIRFAIVYLLTFLVNRLHRLRQIDLEEQFIMAYGGLRGAVAFSLVSLISKDEVSHQSMFETATLAIIIFTVFIQGISIKPFVKLLKIRQAEKAPLSIYEEINFRITDHVMAGIEEICGHYGRNVFRERLDKFDNNYVRKWLMKDPATKDDDIMEIYHRIALQMHFENVEGCAMADEFTSELELYKPTYIDPLGPSDEELLTGGDLAQMSLDEEVKYPPYMDNPAHVPHPMLFHRGGRNVGPDVISNISFRSNRSSYQRRHREEDVRANGTKDAPGRSLLKDVVSNEMNKSIQNGVQDHAPNKDAPPRMNRWKKVVQKEMLMKPADEVPNGGVQDTGGANHRWKNMAGRVNQAFSGEHTEAGKKDGEHRNDQWKLVFNKMFKHDSAENKSAENLTVEDFRKLLVKNPTRQGFHHKYDPNLTKEGTSDLVHHLQEKRKRNYRMRLAFSRMSSSIQSPSPSMCDTASLRNRDGTAGRGHPTIDVVNENSANNLHPGMSSPYPQRAHQPLQRLSLTSRGSTASRQHSVSKQDNSSPIESDKDKNAKTHREDRIPDAARVSLSDKNSGDKSSTGVPQPSKDAPRPPPDSVEQAEPPAEEEKTPPDLAIKSGEQPADPDSNKSTKNCVTRV